MNRQLDAFVRGLNEAWQREDWHHVSACYHPDVVLLPPDTGDPIVGASAVVRTYRDFAEAAKLLQFDIPGLNIYSFEQIHMVHMRFALEYLFCEEHNYDAGVEVYAIQASDDLKIVWRSQSVLEHRVLD